jgi:predicted glycogen debranching enzyme
MDTDGLLSCGEPGVQLTWMDAKVGDWVVTPRIGKPVEVQALWLNALWIGARFSSRWKELFEKGKANFENRFWNEAGGGLFDVTDCNHEAGMNDPSIRPNQIFAVGGLPLQLIDGRRANRIVETVETSLLTRVGLRSLAPTEPHAMLDDVTEAKHRLAELIGLYVYLDSVSEPESIPIPSDTPPCSEPPADRLEATTLLRLAGSPGTGA